jgi:hypothetical protein
MPQARAGVIFLNDLTETGPERTVLVFGVGRGGTSAMAGMLRELGVVMGESLHPLKHEWSPLVYDNALDTEKSFANIARMDRKYVTWGWKSPKDIFSVDDFVYALRNPRFIVVFRNMLDILLSAADHEAMDIAALASDVGVVHARLGRFIAETPYPVALVNYERVIADGVAASRTIDGWLGLKSTPAMIDRAGRFVASNGETYRAVSFDSAHAGSRISEDELVRDRTASHSRIYGNAVAKLCSEIDSISSKNLILSGSVAAVSQELVSTLYRNFGATMPLMDPDRLKSVITGPSGEIATEIGFQPFDHENHLDAFDGVAGETPRNECAGHGDHWEAEFRALRAERNKALRENARLRRTYRLLCDRLECLAH